MQRKDYELIAAVIRELPKPVCGSCGCKADERDDPRHDLAKRFALALWHTDDKFNIDQFTAACLEPSNEELLAELTATEQAKSAELELEADELPPGVEAVCEVCGEPCEYDGDLCLCKKHQV